MADPGPGDTGGMRQAAPILLVTLGAAWAPLGAQGLQRTPLDPGPPPRPLLLFATRDEQVLPVEHRWYLVDAAGGPAREFLRGPEGLSVVGRLDLRRILVESPGPPGGLCVLDLAKGTSRLVGDRAAKFVGVRGGDVLFLGDARHDDHRLYAQAWSTTGERRALAEVRVEKVWWCDDAAVAVSAGHAPEVWWIDLHRGGGRKLLNLPGGQEAGWSLEAAVAPGGRHIALGLPNGTLRVHAAADGALVREWTGIPLALSPFSSFSPRLKCKFLDADTVIATESRVRAGGIAVDFVTVRRSVASGEVLGEAAHVGNLAHEPPVLRLPPVSELWGWPAGSYQERAAYRQFDFDGNGLYFRGAKEPIAVWAKETIANGIEFAPDGSFAVVLREAGKDVLDVVDPGTRTRRRVHQGWTTQRIWLPAPP